MTTCTTTKMTVASRAVRKAVMAHAGIIVEMVQEELLSVSLRRVLGGVVIRSTSGVPMFIYAYTYKNENGIIVACGRASVILVLVGS